MIECTACNILKEVSEYSPQKTNPAKLYAWCDKCRKERGSLSRNRRDFRKEMEALRAKGRERRSFGPVEAREIRILAELGQDYNVIAEQYKVTNYTINRVVNRKGAYSEI